MRTCSFIIYVRGFRVFADDYMRKKILKQISETFKFLVTAKF